MSELQTFLLVVEHNKEEALHIAGVVAQKLETKEITLVDVVQSLGEYINDGDAIIRGKAVSYLTAVIKALPPRFLSRQQILVLTTFFCERMEDGGAIAGLQNLQGLDRFNKEMAEMTTRALFKHHQDLQILPQSQRFQVLQLLNDLMSNYREVLRDMGNESLIGIVDLVNGEKDPRNLMLIFSILKVIMVEWDTKAHVEELFDSVYNYFPITFRPPPNDPYGITAQDLKSRLQECIASTKHFAPHAFPALLDKLDSTSPNVKKDALNAITACVMSYDPTTVSRYSITIWDTLKFEVLNAQEEILAEESLKSLQALAKRLSGGPSSLAQQSVLAQYLRPITKECIEQLREPQQKQAKPARQIIRSLSAASAASFTLIVQAVVAPLLTVYQEADGIAKQRALLEALVSIFDSAIDLYGRWNTQGSDDSLENPLSAFQDQLSEMFSQALMGTAKEEVSFRVTALKGLLRLSILKGYFQDNEIGLFVQYLDEILLKEESYSRDDLKKEAIHGLAELSRYKPRLIMDITFPAFVATLPDSDEDGRASYLVTLESLAQISTEKELFETLVRRLLNKFDVLLNAGSVNSTAYPRAILMTILYVMKQRDLINDPNLNFYYEKIVVNLCRRSALLTTADVTKNALSDPDVVDTLGRLCTIIIHSLPRERQEDVRRNIYDLFATESGFTPVPFSETTGTEQRQTMILSTYFLAGLPKDIKDLPHTTPDVGSLLQELIRLAAPETNLATHRALLRHIALLVNKFLPSSELGLASDILFSLLPTEEKDTALTSGTIRAIFWLSKALVLRLAPSTTKILTSLLSLLASSDAAISMTAARGFALLLSPDEVLSATNGANIRLLSKQRVFTTAVPMISTSIRDFNSKSAEPSSALSHTKPAYLTALSGILSTIPPELVMPELPTLLPLLLQSLDLDDPGSPPVKAATLETLAVIIKDNGVELIDEVGHVGSLVTRLLKTARYQPRSTVQVDDHRFNGPQIRANALRCLYLLAHTSGGAAAAAAKKGKPSPLLPHKNIVVRALKLILDDPKREVRKAAVDARGSWLREAGEDPDDDD